jgi:hypothetical protein
MADTSEVDELLQNIRSELANCAPPLLEGVESIILPQAETQSQIQSNASQYYSQGPYSMQQQNIQSRIPSSTGMYQWVTANDDRVCPICMARDGMTYSTSSMPYVHPNCRCKLEDVAGGEHESKYYSGIGYSASGPSQMGMTGENTSAASYFMPWQAQISGPQSVEISANGGNFEALQMVTIQNLDALTQYLLNWIAMEILI